jgi:DNA polymerase-3 subunit epsilon
MRQVVLDTETTGLEPEAGHRIIEIGCVEIVNRRPTNNRFHRYVNPGRAVDAGALQVHGIENDFLATQPRFAEVAQEFVEFVKGAELVIHNADFDVNFLNHELSRIDGVPHEIRDCCGVLDTLVLARRMHPGQRNSLDALAKRYDVDVSKRDLHGALLDAQILTDNYLAMTGGQVSLSLDTAQQVAAAAGLRVEQRVDRNGLELVVQRAAAEELSAHDALLAKIAKRCGRPLVWPSDAHSEVLQSTESAAA